jgi:hypothetical protein
LSSISNAVVLQVLRNKTISSTASWAADAASWLDLAPASVATNSRGYSRAFLVDPSGWLGTVTLPYTQSTNGAAVTNTARVLIISTISSVLPVSSSSPVSASGFNDIWITPERSKPIDSSGATWSSWNGKGEDLVVQRINLHQLFHRVILYNRDGPSRPGYFTMDGAGPEAVPNELDSYFLDGSTLSLLGGSLVASSSEMITKDLSRFYESGNWTDTIGPGPPSPAANDFQSVAYNFIMSPTNGIGPYAVSSSLLEFMSAYSSWANLSPCFDYRSKPANKVPENLILQDIVGCFSGSGSCAIVP